MHNRHLLLSAATLFATPAVAQQPALPSDASQQAVLERPVKIGQAWHTATRLRRGVNIVGYDPLWRDPAKARFKKRHFRIIKQGGFDFVRVVLQSFEHMDAQHRLNPKWL